LSVVRAIMTTPDILAWTLRGNDVVRSMVLLLGGE
jgi:hypothetical protein